MQKFEFGFFQKDEMGSAEYDRVCTILSNSDNGLIDETPVQSDSLAIVSKEKTQFSDKFVSCKNPSENSAESLDCNGMDISEDSIKKSGKKVPNNVGSSNKVKSDSATLVTRKPAAVESSSNLTTSNSSNIVPLQTNLNTTSFKMNPNSTPFVPKAQISTPFIQPRFPEPTSDYGGSAQPYSDFSYQPAVNHFPANNNPLLYNNLSISPQPHLFGMGDYSAMNQVNHGVLPPAQYVPMPQRAEMINYNASILAAAQDLQNAFLPQVAIDPHTLSIPPVHNNRQYDRKNDHRKGKRRSQYNNNKYYYNNNNENHENLHYQSATTAAVPPVAAATAVPTAAQYGASVNEHVNYSTNSYQPYVDANLHSVNTNPIQNNDISSSTLSEPQYVLPTISNVEPQYTNGTEYPQNIGGVIHVSNSSSHFNQVPPHATSHFGVPTTSTVYPCSSPHSVSSVTDVSSFQSVNNVNSMSNGSIPSSLVTHVTSPINNDLFVKLSGKSVGSAHKPIETKTSSSNQSASDSCVKPALSGATSESSNTGSFNGVVKEQTSDSPILEINSSDEIIDKPTVLNGSVQLPGHSLLTERNSKIDNSVVSPSVMNSNKVVITDTVVPSSTVSIPSQVLPSSLSGLTDKVNQASKSTAKPKLSTTSTSSTQGLLNDCQSSIKEEEMAASTTHLIKDNAPTTTLLATDKDNLMVCSSATQSSTFNLSSSTQAVFDVSGLTASPQPSTALNHTSNTRNEMLSSSNSKSSTATQQTSLLSSSSDIASADMNSEAVSAGTEAASLTPIDSKISSSAKSCDIPSVESAVSSTVSNSAAPVSSAQKPQASVKGDDVSELYPPSLPAPAPSPLGNSSWASLLRGTNSAKSAIVVNNGSSHSHSTSNVSNGFSSTEASSNHNSTDVLLAEKEQCIRTLAKSLSNVRISHKMVSIEPRGLINRGNWCYVNSTLQALLACPPFFHLMKRLPNKQAESRSTPITDSLIDFISEFQLMPPMKLRDREGKKNKIVEEVPTGKSFEPTYIYNMLQTIQSNSSFKNGHQEDAEEFLSCVLNGIHEEMIATMSTLKDLNPVTSSPSTSVNGNVSMNEKDNNSSDTDPLNDQWEQVGPRNKAVIIRSTESKKSPVSEIFSGQIRSVLHQQGKRESATLQPFFTLPLDIQGDNIRSVIEAIESMNVKESINDFICSTTKSEVTAFRRLSLEELPPVLILHLKWFIYDKNGGCQKLFKNVKYSVELTINKEVLSTNVRNKYLNHQRTYKLFAVVNHHGARAIGGHYTTDVFNPGVNKWIRTDDGQVRLVSESEVLHYVEPKVPYLLYYRRADLLARNQ